MNCLVVYDSYFGNTEKIARAIGNALLQAEGHQVTLKKAGQTALEDLAGVDLFVLGCPTRAFQPTEGAAELVKGLPAEALAGKKVLVFDTRIAPEDTPNRVLRVMVRAFGYAAGTLGKKILKKGAELSLPPEGFFVTGSEGPLREGEEERAAEWVRGVL